MSITRVNTNFDAIFSTNTLKQTELQLQKAMARVSSGKRINYASDDPMGVGMLTMAKASLGGARVAQQNIQESLAMLQFADGVMQNFEDKIIELRDLAIRAANDATLTDGQKDALGEEYSKISDQLANGVMKGVKWNGKDLFSAGAAAITVQVGGGSTDNFTFDINQLDNSTQGGTGGDFGAEDISSAGDPAAALTALDLALNGDGTTLDGISGERARIGAVMKQLEYSLESQLNLETNYASAVSTIGDADMAAEISKLTTAQIISQTASAMLGQANIHSQTLLNILM